MLGNNTTQNTDWGKTDGGKHFETYLMSLGKCMGEQLLGEIAKRQCVLRATKKRLMCKAMVTEGMIYVLKEKRQIN